MDQRKFLVDRMLGRLVAWLRIFDYDTLSALELDLGGDEDEGLLELARAESRLLLSRDRALVGRALKSGIPAVLISPDRVQDQLCELLNHFPLKTTPVMERCTVCNHRIRRASLAEVRQAPDAVPGRLADEGKDFWVCDSCGKFYWLGSHWRNIERTAFEIKRCKK